MGEASTDWVVEVHGGRGEGGGGEEGGGGREGEGVGGVKRVGLAPS
jgi:hypothetical protein